MSLHRYWAQVFILPKSILKEVNQICRAFLWSRNAFSNKIGVVAWDQLCWGKDVRVVASKQDNVWIKQVNAVYLKEGNWQNYTPKQGATSWYWKRICQVKEDMKRFYSEIELSNLAKYNIHEVYEQIKGGRETVADVCVSEWGHHYI